jgi:hypothetical protein
MNGVTVELFSAAGTLPKSLPVNAKTNPGRPSAWLSGAPDGFFAESVHVPMIALPCTHDPPQVRDGWAGQSAERMLGRSR